MRRRSEQRGKGSVALVFRGARLLVAVLLLSAAGLSMPARANELSVDRRSLRVDESLSIIVTLEDDFASIDSLVVPARNLEVDDAPSVSTEMSWINGTMSRRKVFRFSARPLAPGPALVGPLVIESANGRRETLGPIPVQVIADAASRSNDPQQILRELLATGREPFFVVAEIDKPSVFTGEELVVTWVLYNGARVQQWQLARVPKLEDFWTEELDVRSETPQQVFVGDTVMQRVAIRRVALFPLRSGTVSIGSVEVAAEVMRRTDDSPFGLFEGTLVETRFPSAPLTVDVQPLPPGPAPGAVGTFTMRCGPPRQPGGGAVGIEVTIAGRGNLRAASAPRFAEAVDGETEVQPGALDVARRAEGEMTRRWSVVIFPRRDGTLKIPPLVETIFDPQTRAFRELRCEGTSLAVTRAVPSARVAAAGSGAPLPSRRTFLPMAAAVVLLAAFAWMAVPRLRRAVRLRHEVRRLAGGTPSQIREAVEAYLLSRKADAHVLMQEISERGDAYRAFRSLVDALEHDRAHGAGRRELETRLRDLVQSLG